jgi:hypothetical protein
VVCLLQKLRFGEAIFLGLPAALVANLGSGGVVAAIQFLDLANVGVAVEQHARLHSPVLAVKPQVSAERL